MFRPTGKNVILRHEIQRGIFTDKAIYRVLAVGNGIKDEIPLEAHVEVEGTLHPLEYAGERFFVCKIDKIIGYYHEDI